MEQPKRKEKPKRGEEFPQIEFAAPYSLAECLFRLRDTRHLQPGFISPGIDPTFEKTDAITYQFRIRRTWYDYRYRRHNSYVEVRGYLRALDNGTTIVIARIRISPLAMVLMGLLIVLLAVVWFVPDARGTDWFLVLPFVAIVVVFAATLYADRRTLIHLLHTALAGDV